MTEQLHEKLRSGSIVIAPGVYDALGALIAEQAGFEALYISGASLAYTQLGKPDIGYLGLPDVARSVGLIRDRVELPLIVDADTGFGNALNVKRTVQVLERSGATAIQLEDQSMPKRCGHLDGKELVSKSEMVGKIKAATDARKNDHTLIIARTDGVAVEGLESALDRAAAYRDAGADMLFVEALRSEDEMRLAIQKLGTDIPMMANMVEGGKTPAKDASELEGFGFSLVIFPGGLVRAIAKTAGDYFASLKQHRTNQPFKDRMFDFDGLNDLLGTPGILQEGKKYEEEGNGS